MELAATAWLRISQGGLRALSGTVCLLALLAPSQGRAQEVAARAYLTPASVVLNGQFVLNIEIRGVQRADADPELPLIGSFGRYLGASRRRDTYDRAARTHGLSVATKGPGIQVFLE